MLKQCLVAAFVFCLLTAGPLLAAWEDDMRLTTSQPGQGPSSFAPRWCAASGDNVHVVWGDNRNPSQDVFHKRSTDGGATWGSDFNLADTLATSEYPAVAASGSYVYAAWTDGRDENEEIYFRASNDAGATWGGEARLTQDDALSHPPTLACWGPCVYLLWVDGRTPYGMQIFYKMSTDAGATWTPDAQLPNQDAAAGMPSIAVYDTMVHALWSDTRNGTYQPFYKRSFDRGLTWSADMALSSGIGTFPSIIASGMDVHATWVSWEAEVIYRRSTDGGETWGAEQQLSLPSDGSNLPSVGCDGQLVHVAWSETRYASASEIAYRRSQDRGVTWEDEVRLTTAEAASSLPQLVASGDRVHVAFWDARDNVPGEVYYKRDPVGNVPGVAEDLQPWSRAHGTLLRPNPVVNLARVPGHEAEWFVVFDAAGRPVQECSGERVGAGLTAGVYLLRAAEGNVGPIRFIKLQ